MSDIRKITTNNKNLVQVSIPKEIADDLRLTNSNAYAAITVKDLDILEIKIIHNEVK
ncbi:MAG: hypothetical protein ACRDB0_04970 [Paraclostridium sp.]